MYSRSNLIVSPLPDGKHWKTEADFEVNIDGFRIKYILIEPDFVFDFASTPRFLWSIFPPATGKYTIPATVHDYLYKTKRLARKEADDIFLYLMEQEGVTLWKRYVLYLGVRLFGGKYYDAA